MGFLASKFSGYLAIALMALIAGAMYWAYSRGVSIQELQQASDKLETVERQIESKRAVLGELGRDLDDMREQALTESLKRQEALRNADQSFDDCFNTDVLDGMRIDY